MGYKMDLSYSGEYQGETLEVDMLQQIELLGYDLDNNLFHSLSIYWTSIILALFVVSTLGIIIKKRRK